MRKDDDAARQAALDIADCVSSREVAAIEVVTSCLSRVEAINPAVNAFTSVYRERALAKASAVDQLVQRGAKLPLAGVPFAVKNLFDVAGETTIAGSNILASNAVSRADAVLIQRIEAQGGVLVGSLNMGEFAYDFTGENQHFGPCRNPWNLAYMTGGSSSGSGAALAAGMVPLTLGSDTNGSIRVPSAFCANYGLKPTYGRLPRSGTYPFCDSLDHVGVMARSLPDLAALYNSVQGYDAQDHACANRSPDFVDPSASIARPLRVGVWQGYFDPVEFKEATGVVSKCAEAFASSSAVVDYCELALAEAGRSAAFLITNVEGANLHYESIVARANEFDPDTRDRFIAGSLLPAAWYIRAQRLRKQYAEEAARLLTQFDILLAAATPIRAPLLGQKTMLMGGDELNVRANLGYFTQPISCIGLPVISAPVPQSNGPNPAPGLGVQIISAPWREDLCFMAAAQLSDSGITRGAVATVGAD